MADLGQRPKALYIRTGMNTEEDKIIKTLERDYEVTSCQFSHELARLTSDCKASREFGFAVVFLSSCVRGEYDNGMGWEKILDLFRESGFTNCPVVPFSTDRIRAKETNAKMAAYLKEHGFCVLTSLGNEPGGELLKNGQRALGTLVKELESSRRSSCEQMRN